jgi:hypothetical protein
MIQELGASDPGRWLAFCMEAMQHGSLADADDYADAGDDEGEGDKKKVRCRMKWALLVGWFAAIWPVSAP